MLDPCLLTDLSELQINCQCGDRGSHFNESLSNLLEGLFGLVDQQCSKFSEWGVVYILLHISQPFIPCLFYLPVHRISLKANECPSKASGTPKTLTLLHMSCQPPESCDFRVFLQGLLL